MDLGTTLGTAGGAIAGALATAFVFRYRRGGSGGGEETIAHRSASPQRGTPPVLSWGDQDPRGGLARKSLDALRVGVVVLDPDDQPVVVNPSARAMGLLRSGGQPGRLAAHPVVRTLAAQVRRSGVRREVELDLPRVGEAGAADPLGVILRAVGLGGGYVSVEAADATESHRVARVRRDFVANVGHELKTPIGALQLLSEALLEAAEDTAAARRFAERIRHESTRLGRLVNELLELSRVQGAEPLPEPKPVSVAWLVSEVLDRARTGAAAKRIELAVSGEQDLTVYGSDSQLATALANLVDNAVTYSPEGSRVDIVCAAADDQVQISVIDRGIGIAARDLDRIFERFYRSDRARSRATGGTGLGLAIVKHIATNHGGRVDVVSTPGEGSTFTLRLPARPQDVVSGAPALDEVGTDEAERPAGPAPSTSPQVQSP